MLLHYVLSSNLGASASTANYVSSVFFCSVVVTKQVFGFRFYADLSYFAPSSVPRNRSNGCCCSVPKTRPEKSFNLPALS